MNPKHITPIWLAAFLVAWCFDQLFWQKTPGISIPIFTLLVTGAGLALAWGERLRPALRSLWLLLPLGFFSIMTAFRLEPFTILINILLVLASMVLLALTLRSGAWMQYSLSDDFGGFLRLGINALANPVRFFSRSKPAEGQPVIAARGSRRQAGAILRGLLLALPVVAVLAALLASADPIFADRLSRILDFSRIDRLGEYIFRLFYILVIGYILLGVYLHGLFNSQEVNLIGIEKPWLPPFLGWTEAIVVLISVDLLFAAFVGIQFSYFFGGRANINLAGYTYSSYARRGFDELVTVALLSLFLLLGLSTITRRVSRRERSLFSGLSVSLVVLVAVILISAFQRLLLYEAAYGFTRIRTYTHIFMVWLGILLAATAVLELFQRQRAFALAALLVSLGFGMTLNLINVDGFIGRENVARAVQGSELDFAYLASLSDDVVPELVSAYQQPGQIPAVKTRIGAALACRPAVLVKLNRDAWPSYHFSAARAKLLLTALQPSIDAANPVQESSTQGWTIMIDGQTLPCAYNGGPMN